MYIIPEKEEMKPAGWYHDSFAGLPAFPALPPKWGIKVGDKSGG
jgi:hypothetical protein